MHRSAQSAQCAPLSCEKRDGCIPWQSSRLFPFWRRHVFTYLTKGREANLQAQTWGVSTGHFFIFRCATLSGSRGRFGQKSPIWTKHGAKSFMRPALPVRYERDEIQAVYFAQERSEKGGVQHGLFRWQLFLYWHWQGYRQACVISHRHVCSVSFGSSETDGWLLRYGHFKFATLSLGQIRLSALKNT